MSPYRTADETRAEFEAKLGPELGAALHELEQDLLRLHLKWRHYRELYGTKPERIDLLNQVSPTFFRIVEDALWDDTLLHVCRLTDPADSGGRQRLSIRRLPALIADSQVRTKLEPRIQAAVDAATFARDWRNRRIAHLDLPHALDPKTRPLAPASRLAVENVLLALREVLNFLNGQFRNTEMNFDETEHMSDAHLLLRVLHDGLTVRDERLRALQEGRLSPRDWHLPPAV